MQKDKRSYVVEDFLKESNDLLEEISEGSGFINDLPTESAEAVGAKIRKDALDSIGRDVESQINGYVDLAISRDEMNVIAGFFPAKQSGESITVAEVDNVLAGNEITYGIDREAITEAVDRCDIEREPVADVVIAQGTEPINEVPAHLEIEKSLLRGGDKPVSGDMRIDFKKQSPFVLVKQDDVLARAVGLKPGVMGSTIKGAFIPYGKASVAQIKADKNTKTYEKTVVATCDGRFEYTNKKFWVNEVLEINGDVDYKTGHIDFPGDVIIRGEIQDGFSVEAGGSIFCGKTMDASEVVCQGDVFVEQGIIGKKDGFLRAEGKLSAQFIENCYVQAGGTLSVKTGLMNSSVHTLDRIEMGLRGIITGGKTHAQKGVSTTQIGSRSGTKTEVYCGVNFAVEQKLEWIRDRNIQLAIKLNRVKAEISRSSSENKSLIELRDKIAAAIHKMNSAASSLVSSLDRNEDAEVIAKGDVFPGVYIEICHCSHIVNRKLNGVRFRLDKKVGTVMAIPLMRQQVYPIIG